MQPQKALRDRAGHRESRPSIGAKTECLYEIHHIDAFEWLASAPMKSIEAIVTDPPYGLVEYSDKELTKLKAGKSGGLGLPPAFDCRKSMPPPPFSGLTPNHPQTP